MPQVNGWHKIDSLKQCALTAFWLPAGDIATFPYQHTGQPLRIEHWGFAENTGRTVALNIAGKHKKFTHVPYFWTVSSHLFLSHLEG